MSKAGFRELQVWQRAKALTVDMYRITETGAISRDFGLRDQMRRSAVSICSNIAEGDERGTDKDSVRFLYIAKGSLAELATQTEIAAEVGYLAKDDAARLQEALTEIGRMLGALIKARSAA
jgi:four helix bundle protein